MKKLLLVAGARPNFMKIAPLIRRLWQDYRELVWKLVHTGQHYDYEMSRAFFEDLEIPEPDHFLEVGSGSHAQQTGRVMTAFEKVCGQEKPDCVVVVGDVNSTMACAVTAKKMLCQVAHVEAGLRSRDESMPEEINRIVTDAVSDHLFVTEKSGLLNLKDEGKRDGQVHWVGNIMIDTLHLQLAKLQQADTGDAAGPAGNAAGRPYAVVTLHRPANVDEPYTLQAIVEALAEISLDMPVYFPAHPRTRKQLETFRLTDRIRLSNIELLEPMSYTGFLRLWKDAALVLTDSGGIQEETTALGVPCFTVRDNTERPVTVIEGTNLLVGTTRESILKAYAAFKLDGPKTGTVPELWDGRAAERIVKILAGQLIRS